MRERGTERAEESERTSHRIAWEVLRCNGEGKREKGEGKREVKERKRKKGRKRKERWNERESEIGIAGEQLRTRATYDSTLADYARRGVERFDKTRGGSRSGKRRFHGLVNIFTRIGRFVIRFVFIYSGLSCLSLGRLIGINDPSLSKIAGFNGNFLSDERRAA